jgi:hypothetical protein
MKRLLIATLLLAIVAIAAVPSQVNAKGYDLRVENAERWGAESNSNETWRDN